MIKKIKVILVLLLSFLLNFNIISDSKSVFSLNNNNIKSVAYAKNDKKIVYVGGVPVGVKLKTVGVIVVALSDIECKDGRTYSPANEDGIRIGDIILSINGEEINSSNDVAKVINDCKDGYLDISLERSEKLITKRVKAIESKEGKYKIGLWVRDSTSGVGTLTFYDKETNKFAALGHAIADIDTNQIIKIKDGSIVESSIVSVKKGEKGEPGELRGIFLEEEDTLGSIKLNSNFGIYGTSNNNLIKKYSLKPYEVAKIGEIQEGPAQIITTLEGQETKLYNIRIDKLLDQKSSGTKSMIIVITDEELLQKSGGIVQGMSGSPIIQNNKIIGAVTHVLINKPEVGYGIYAQWMIEEMNKIDN